MKFFSCAVCVVVYQQMRTSANPLLAVQPVDRENCPEVGERKDQVVPEEMPQTQDVFGFG
jgi:hypothetical protein